MFDGMRLLKSVATEAAERAAEIHVYKSMQNTEIFDDIQADQQNTHQNNRKVLYINFVLHIHYCSAKYPNILALKL